MELYHLPSQRADEPLYRQLYFHLRDLILAHEIEAGERLPAKRQLAHTLGIGQNTVVRAYEQLIDEGYIEARERSGYYVRTLDSEYQYSFSKPNIEAPKAPRPLSFQARAHTTTDFSYDFGYGGVDRSSLPLKDLQRLYRQLLKTSEMALSRSPEDQGELPVREAIALHLRQSRGLLVDPAAIVLGSGTDYLLKLLLDIFPTDAVYGIEDPGFLRIAETLKLKQKHFHPLPLDEEGIDMQSLEASDVDILTVTPSHQFPSGQIYPISRRMALLNWLSKSERRYLIEDDYDSEFKFTNRPIPPLLSLDQTGRVIYLGSFSKSFTPALRLSYLVLPESLLSIYRHKAALFSCPVPVLSQLVMAEFIQSGQFSRHLNRVRQIYAKKREKLVTRLEAAGSYIVSGAEAGLHLLLEVPGLETRVVIEEAARQGLRLQALHDYQIEANCPDKILLSYAQIPLEEIDEAVDLLNQVVETVRTESSRPSQPSKSLDFSAIPEGARVILERLNSVGEGYIVGGAVRDLLLNRTLHDVDLASNLSVLEVSELFREHPQLHHGEEFGTVVIQWADGDYEVTSYREEGPYHDARHPSFVRRASTIEEDLSRRDFTINALALGEDGKIVDPYGGQDDLSAGLIRAVGEPHKRFQEDALRILRAVRFANRLDFEIEGRTEEAMRDLAPELRRISDERIAAEFLQILSDNPRGVTRLHEVGILAVIFPEIDQLFDCRQECSFHLYDVGRHSVEAACAATTPEGRLAALLHDLGKPACKTYDEQGTAHFYNHAEESVILAREILEKLKIPKRQRELILRAIALHDYLSVKPYKWAKLIAREEDAVWPLLFELKWADISAQSDDKRSEKELLIEQQETLVKRLLAGPHRLRDLAVNGHDLMTLGLSGPVIAEALQEILIYVMLDPIRNDKPKLITRLRKMYQLDEEALANA